MFREFECISIHHQNSPLVPPCTLTCVFLCSFDLSALELCHAHRVLPSFEGSLRKLVVLKD